MHVVIISLPESVQTVQTVWCRYDKHDTKLRSTTFSLTKTQNRGSISVILKLRLLHSPLIWISTMWQLRASDVLQHSLEWIPSKGCENRVKVTGKFQNLPTQPEMVLKKKRRLHSISLTCKDINNLRCTKTLRKVSQLQSTSTSMMSDLLASVLLSGRSWKRFSDSGWKNKKNSSQGN